MPMGPMGGYGQPQQMGYMPQMMQQVQQPQQPQQPGYTCRPVTGREEALAMQIDFLGLGTIMPDVAHDVVYIKRFDPTTGAAIFCEYRRYQPQDPAPARYVSVDDFVQLVSRVQRLEGGATDAADQ